MDESLRVRLNVGGAIFETLFKTVKTCDKIASQVYARQKDEEQEKAIELFFDRNPVAFASVLEFYRNGILAPPPTLDKRILAKELEFWGLDAHSSMLAVVEHRQGIHDQFIKELSPDTIACITHFLKGYLASDDFKKHMPSQGRTSPLLL